MSGNPRGERKDGARPDRFTVWGEALDPESVLQEYPRPQLVRDSYLNLNGLWQYAILTQPGETPGAHSSTAPGDVADGQILVPFSPETPCPGWGVSCNNRGGAEVLAQRHRA
ncbi:hypothetical protein NHF46_02360 [Arthrobacter alpinus]|nr:hypothetical protein [Arthrobacter alpinus]